MDSADNEDSFRAFGQLAIASAADSTRLFIGTRGPTALNDAWICDGGRVLAPFLDHL
jgi:hypothetical protein